MLKRREDSQAFTRQILERIEDRTKQMGCAEDIPSITVIARPVFPHRPVISTSDIYELPDRIDGPPRRVSGGVYSLDKRNHYRFLESNEYGICYCRAELYGSDEKGLDYDQFIGRIKNLTQAAKDLYKKCEYLGNIEITVQLRQVFGKKLYDPEFEERITANIEGEPECFDSEVFVSKQCLPRDLENTEKRIDIIEELTCQLFWAFNIPNTTQIRERIRKRIEDIL